MSAAPRRSQSIRAPRQPAATRGISSSDIDRAADALLREGERPTIEKVRVRIGRGSPNTINPLLDAWWQRLAGRLDAGPAALHRLPEPVLLATEGLWLQTLDEARRRAAAEQGSTKASLARERQEMEVRSHVLSIREAELRDHIAQAEERASRLELELQTLVTMLRKEQASRAAAERRFAEAATATPRPPRRRARPTRLKAKSRKQVNKSSRAQAPTTRRVPSRRGAHR